MRYHVVFIQEGNHTPKVQVDAEGHEQAIAAADPPTVEGTIAALAWFPPGEFFPKTACFLFKEGKWELYSKT